MNHRPPSPDALDHSLRQLHADAVASISPATLARLRAARQRAGRTATPSRRHRRGWLLATACSAVLAVALGLNFATLRPELPLPGDEAMLASLLDDDAMLLDETPELYLWLGSDNALAME